MTSASKDLRGAVILGTLVLVCLVIAVVGSIFAIGQLDRADAQQVRLSDALGDLDAVLRAQLDEETGVRGYVATHQRNLLEPYRGTMDPFTDAAAMLDRDLALTHVAGAAPLLADLRRLHDRWDREVARVLLSQRIPRDSIAIETTAKLLIDGIRADSTDLRSVLNEERQRVGRDLRRKINRTVALSALIDTAFAIGAIMIAFGRSVAVAALARQHSIVVALQRSLRAKHAPLRGTKIGTSYISATADAELGGDLFDVWQAPGDRDYVLSADFSGKGIDVAVHTAFVQFAIRTLSMEHSDPAEIMTAFNRLFIHTIADPTLFVVIFLGRFDAKTRTLTFTSAGHGAAFLRAARSVDTLAVTGPIVGIAASSVYEARSIRLSPSDLLLLATDGLTESRDRDGELLGETQAKRLIADGPADPQALCDRLVEEVLRRAGGTIKDDLALLAIEVDSVDRAAPAAIAGDRR